MHVQAGFVPHAHVHLCRHGPVAPQKTAVGQIARIALGQFLQTGAGLATRDKILQRGAKVPQVVQIVFLARRAGKERPCHIQKARLKPHPQPDGLRVQLGGIRGLDIGNFRTGRAFGAGVLFLAKFVNVLRSAYAMTDHGQRCGGAAFKHIEEQGVRDQKATLERKHTRQLFEHLGHDNFLFC